MTAASTGRGVARLPMRAVDRLGSGIHILSVFGPVALPGREALVDAVWRILSVGPDARLGLRAVDGREWEYAPESLREVAERMVVEAPELATRELSEALEGLVAHIEPGLPMRVVLAGDRLLLILDHGVVDARFTTRLPATLVAVAGGGEIPAWLTAEGISRPLWTAFVETFAKHPGRVVALLRARRVESPVAPRIAPVERPSIGWNGSTSVVVAAGSKASFKALHNWLRRRDEPVSFGAGVIVALRAALAAEGLRLSPDSEMVYDVRGYLPSGVDTTGNFVTGIPVTGGDDLTAVDRSIAQTTSSGRPLAALMAGAIKESVRPARRVLPASTPAHARARVVLSNLGLNRPLQSIPWIRDGRSIEAASAVHPIAPETVAAQLMVLDGVLHVAVSYNDTSFDREAVQRAVRAFVDDPVALLDGVVSREDA
ncbi:MULTISPECIES: hypothetical protein [unclassified Frigoribacterium]|uniref:hypothetical protein n=1 Tax=unclassified Frigoribacterium TaxID=2627005 RepID=UPI000701511A|nr:MULTISPECIES: hypothetical protein [unclassified Frigoribacterium]KQO82619.1 hypothetical protein ASF17_06085 [Frigoribacterium sp. Leaf263]KQR64698.1 hypothetical protein ASF89_09540 [Frigoribacterium sp. Leaf172]